MAKKKRRSSKTARNEKYYELIADSYKRLRGVMKKHRPDIIAKE